MAAFYEEKYIVNLTDFANNIIFVLYLTLKLALVISKEKFLLNSCY